MQTGAVTLENSMKFPPMLKIGLAWAIWMAQSHFHLTLDICSSQNLTIMGLSYFEFCTSSMKLAWDSFFLSLSAPLPFLLFCTLFLSNKFIKRKYLLKSRSTLLSSNCTISCLPKGYRNANWKGYRQLNVFIMSNSQLWKGLKFPLTDEYIHITTLSIIYMYTHTHTHNAISLSHERQ